MISNRLPVFNLIQFSENQVECQVRKLVVLIWLDQENLYSKRGRRSSFKKNAQEDLCTYITNASSTWNIPFPKFTKNINSV